MNKKSSKSSGKKRTALKKKSPSVRLPSNCFLPSINPGLLDSANSFSNFSVAKKEQTQGAIEKNLAFDSIFSTLSAATSRGSVTGISGVGLLSIRENGLIEDCDGLRILGYPAGELSGRRIMTIFSEVDRHEQLPEAHSILAANCGCYRTFSRLVNYQGNAQWCLLFYRCFRTESLLNKSNEWKRKPFALPMMLALIEITPQELEQMTNSTTAGTLINNLRAVKKLG
jgi:hypothetical protein